MSTINLPSNPSPEDILDVVSILFFQEGCPQAIIVEALSPWMGKDDLVSLMGWD